MGRGWSRHLDRVTRTLMVHNSCMNLTSNVIIIWFNIVLHTWLLESTTLYAVVFFSTLSNMLVLNFEIQENVLMKALAIPPPKKNKKTTTKHSTIAGLILAHCLHLWPNIKPASGKRLVSSGSDLNRRTQQTRGVEPMLF